MESLMSFLPRRRRSCSASATDPGIVGAVVYARETGASFVRRASRVLAVTPFHDPNLKPPSRRGIERTSVSQVRSFAYLRVPGGQGFATAPRGPRNRGLTNTPNM